MAKKNKTSVLDIQKMYTIKCKHCHGKNEIHAYGTNKKLAQLFNTNKMIISSACWNQSCPLKGKEVQQVEQ